MTKVERYHYRQCGLEDVYLVNGFERESSARYGDTVKIRNIEGLHRAIGRYLVREKKTLVGAEIRFLRHELKLSQRSLGGLLSKSSQTVARWEKGQGTIDGAADRLLRLIYEGATATKGGRTKETRELLEQLSELDNRCAELVEFEDTNRGWRPFSDAA